MAFGHLGKWGKGLIRDYRFTWTLRFWYKKFVKQIKYRYISGDPDTALPQQKSIIKDAYPVELLSSASKLFARRQIYKSTDRALLGLSPSSVSRLVAIMRKRIAGEQKLKKQISTIKSQIKP